MMEIVCTANHEGMSHATRGFGVPKPRRKRLSHPPGAVENRLSNHKPNDENMEDEEKDEAELEKEEDESEADEPGKYEPLSVENKKSSQKSKKGRAKSKATR